MAEQAEEATSVWRGRLDRAVDTAISINHSVVERHVQRIRARRPDITPAELVAKLEKEYLAAVTTSGAAVGGTAAAPGVGTGLAATIGITEAVASFQASALLALAVAHVHGIDVEDVERRRTLLLAVLFGEGGTKIVEKIAGRTGKHWGTLLTDKTSTATIKSINRALGAHFVTRYGTKKGIVVLGRMAPFGIGAAIGGIGNALLGRTVVTGVRSAFGPAPETFTTPLTVDSTIVEQDGPTTGHARDGDDLDQVRSGQRP